MATFGTKEQILTAISELHQALDAGNLSIEQLDELVNLSQELHQRHIILRYKVFETKVLGKSTPIQEEVIEEEIKTPDVKNEESVAIDLFATTSEPEAVELPLFDFSAEVEEQIETELEDEIQLPVQDESISEDEPLAHEEEELIHNEPASTEIATEVTLQEEVVDLFSLAAEPDSIIEEEPIQEEIEPVVYQSEIYAEQQAIEPTSIHSEEIISETDFGRTVEHHTIIENTNTHEIIQEKHETETMSADEQTISRFLAKFREIEKDTDASMAFARIDSLASAFGLNERLLFINELFNGSSEAFNNAIQVLDNQQSGIDAFLRLAEIGTVNNWNVEISTVTDFMKKVSKRYSN